MALKRELVYLYDLTMILIAKDLKARYKKSMLGYLWSLLHPLSLSIIFYFIFKIIVRFPIENYVVFLLSGLFPWQWITNSIISSTTVLLGNATLIKRVKCPHFVFPLSTVLQDGVHFLLSIPVILIFLKVYAMPISFFLFLYFPLLFILQVLLIYGLALFLSSINLFFRDLERIVYLFLTIAFYFTPIIYPSNLIPIEFKNFFFLNPFFPLVELWHTFFLYQKISMKYLLLSFFYALSFFFIGLFVFKKLSSKFAEAL